MIVIVSINRYFMPAVILISAVSYFTAPVGARLAHRLPVAILKKVFAGLLLLLSLKKMLQTVFSAYLIIWRNWNAFIPSDSSFSNNDQQYY